MTITDAQLEARKGKIMASNVAAVMGVSPWETPFSAWAYATGKVPQRAIEMLPHIRAGNYLEPAVVAWWEDDTGRKVSPSPGTTFHPLYRWLGATRDRQMIADGIARRGPLECKAVSPFKGDAWKDYSAPLHVEIQLQVQMLVPIDDYVDDYGEIGAIVGGFKFEHRKREFDPEFAAAIIYKCRRFWEDHVVRDIPPPLGDSDRDAETLKLMYPQDDGRVVEVGADLKATAVRLYEVRQAIAKLKREEQGIANFVRQTLATGACWTFGGLPILSAKTNKRGVRPVTVKPNNLGLTLPEHTDEEDESDG